MNGQPRAHKIACVFSGMFVTLFLVLVAYAEIEGRWFPLYLSCMVAQLLALVVWLIWISHLIWLLSRRPPIFGRRIPPWAGFLGGVLVLFVAFQVGRQTLGIVRVHETRKAIDAGLRDDCMKLLLNWPVKDDRIEDFDPEFAKLPASIRMFEPTYVKNDMINEPDLPPNIGLCKNGFGGFAMGVRVFRSDQDAKKYEIATEGECERIAPCVYIWWHST